MISLVLIGYLLSFSMTGTFAQQKDITPHSGIETGTITDDEGNVYQTVKIGSQWWMAENLRSTKYRNGDPIPNVTNSADWASLTTPGYCCYGNDFHTYGNDYGLLYNWFTTDPASNGGREIAPEGWHIPSRQEFSTLINTLGGLNEAGGKMKESGMTHWRPPNTGATNASGFTGLPAGIRGYVDGTFKYIGDFGHWWSRTPSDGNKAWNIGLFFLEYSVDQSPSVKKLGFSIRCIKD
jgi:uncharacterized protein (TIGR02145 family)